MMLHMTREYLIDLIMIFIIIVHMLKINYLVGENRRLWRNVRCLSAQLKTEKRRIAACMKYLTNVYDKMDSITEDKAEDGD